MKSYVYIYQNPLKNALVSLFKNLYDAPVIKRLNSQTIRVKTTEKIGEEVIDYEAIHASVLSDFNLDTTLIYLKDRGLKIVSETMILESLPYLLPKAYDTTTLVLELIQKPTYKAQIQKNMLQVLGQDYIHTAIDIARANMNLSTAAKNLYIHRNTLNYRIEKIIEKTDIDIKSFKGLSVFTTLYGF